MPLSPFEPALRSADVALISSTDTAPAMTTITARFTALPTGYQDAPYATTIVLQSASDPSYNQSLGASVAASGGTLTFSIEAPQPAPLDATAEGRARVEGVFQGGVQAPEGTTGAVPLDPRPPVPTAPGGGSIDVTIS